MNERERKALIRCVEILRAMREVYVQAHRMQGKAINLDDLREYDEDISSIENLIKRGGK